MTTLSITCSFVSQLRSIVPCALRAALLRTKHLFFSCFGLPILVPCKIVPYGGSADHCHRHRCVISQYVRYQSELVYFCFTLMATKSVLNLFVSSCRVRRILPATLCGHCCRRSFMHRTHTHTHTIIQTRRMLSHPSCRSLLHSVFIFGEWISTTVVEFCEISSL